MQKWQLLSSLAQKAPIYCKLLRLALQFHFFILLEIDASSESADLTKLYQKCLLCYIPQPSIISCKYVLNKKTTCFFQFLRLQVNFHREIK